MKNNPYFLYYLGIIGLLGTFVNSSCDIKINIKIVQNCCKNLAVRGLSSLATIKLLLNTTAKRKFLLLMPIESFDVTCFMTVLHRIRSDNLPFRVLALYFSTTKELV